MNQAVSRRSRQFDPAEMSLRGRIGAYRLHATHDPNATAANARNGLQAKYEREVDPDGVLPEPERKRRADYARKADMARLALARHRADKAAKKAANIAAAEEAVMSTEEVTA